MHFDTPTFLPRFPQLASLHRCHLPYCPYHRVASIRQSCGNSRCQSKLLHNRSPLIPIPSMLTSLPHTHPPIIRGSLYSIHLPTPSRPFSTSPINFYIHYFFQQSFIIHPLLKTFIYTLAANILLTLILALTTSFLSS